MDGIWYHCLKWHNCLNLTRLMKLPPHRIDRLRQSICDAYDLRSFELMLRTELDVNLSKDVGQTSSELSYVVYQVISWAERRDLVRQLIDGAVNANSTNHSLRLLAAIAKYWHWGPATAPVVRPYSLRSIEAVVVTVATDEDSLRNLCQEFGEIYLLLKENGWDAKTTGEVIVDCCWDDSRRLTALLNRLEAVAPERFAVLQPNVLAPYGLLTDQSGAIVNTPSLVMVEQLSEWKEIHTGSQQLVAALDRCIKYLERVADRRQSSAQRDAGDAWARECVPKLKVVRVRWLELTVASRSVLLAEFQRLVEQPQLDELSRQLRNEDRNYVLTRTLVSIGDFRQFMWELLAFADSRISELADRLRGVNGNG